MSKFIKGIFFLYLLIQINATKLKCDFRTSPVDRTTNFCHFDRDQNIYTTSRIKIDQVEITNLVDNKTIDDIHELNIASVSALYYFPENLAAHFKNIIGIFIYYSNLQEITQQDLQPFPKLQHLSIIDNKITRIDADLFKFNPELRQINLRGNRISHIDANVFDHLDKLTKLNIINNRCKKTIYIAETRSEVLEDIEKIKNGYCSSD